MEQVDLIFDSVVPLLFASLSSLSTPSWRPDADGMDKQKGDSHPTWANQFKYGGVGTVAVAVAVGRGATRRVGRTLALPHSMSSASFQSFVDVAERRNCVHRHGENKTCV